MIRYHLSLTTEEKSRELTDRRRGGGTTGGQQEVFLKIDENNVKNHFER